MDFAEALEIVVGRTKHERFRDLVDPSHRDYNPAYKGTIVAIAAGITGIAVPAGVIHAAPANSGPSPTAPVLAGDLVASLTAAVGADRAAEWVARKLTGVPNCGCESRRIALNRIDEKARRLLKRLLGPDVPG